MKNLPLLFVVIFLIFISCSKKNPDNFTYSDTNFVEPKYDTTPVDSFSKGATSINILRKIRMSSVAYQDSIKQAILKQAEEKKFLDEKAKLEKEAQKILEKAKEEVKIAPKPDDSQSATSQHQPIDSPENK